MEIPIGGTKEKKRRFFRKTGSGSAGSSSSGGGGGGGQNSWESQQSPTTQSAVSSLTNSFENTSITGVGGVSVGMMNNLNFPPSAAIPPSSSSTTVVGGSNQQRGKSHQPLENPQKQAHRHSPANSMSLDEAEHLMMQHRRFMAAPRRARSAERFDGMRINNSPGEKLVQYPLPTREELLDRNQFNSPRPIRPTAVTGGTGRTNLVNDPHRRNPPVSVSGIISPPPPYQAAINEKTGGPPSYRQALAAAAANQKGGTTPLLHRQLAHTHHHNSHHHRGAHSLDSEFGSSGTTMRSAVSVPAFSNDVICSCSKCQIQNKAMMADGYGSVGDYNNDSAVYMESQAFLMHEIMTDGMAFCSIM